MITYNEFNFAAPPRTGSTWFIKAAYEAGLGNAYKAKLHVPPPNDFDGYVVSMIRHPFFWLRSYYYALEGGACGVDCVDVFVEHSRKAKDFNGFVRRYLKHIPGTVGKMFDAYKANSVLQTEELPYNAAELFESVGVRPKMIENAIHAVPPQNRTKNIQHVLNPVLMKEVIEAESDFFEQHDYY